MYEWRDHTAEVELVLDVASEQAVFAEAADAFGRLIELGEGGEPARHEIGVEARDRADLLVAWLDELIYLADTDSFVPDRVASVELGERRIRASVEGRRTALDPLVKAATYHGLEFERKGDGWRARIVLDV